MDLFAACGGAEDRLAQQAPLAARLRPLRLDDIVGQDELVGPGRPLRVLVESDRLSSAIFWGPPGTGKTTLAQVIARHTAKAYEQLSAVSASVKDVREIVARAQPAPRRAGAGHHPVPRRGPPVQQGPAGRPAALGRERAAGAGGRHHREPVLRGQRPAAVPLDPVPAPAAGRGGSPRCCARASTPRAPPPRTRRWPTWPTGPGATGATP